MATILRTRTIEAALVAEGLVPKNCSSATLVMEAGEPIKVRYEILLDHKNMAALSRVFASVAELDAEKG